ncbi:MAG: hypothetical protein JW894_04420 [Bacteroidales bacterium]|nr:hypothetical protein [Bacteroidales bacterium]
MTKRIRLLEFLRSFNVQSATIFLAILLCADLMFFILHLVNILLPDFNNSLYSLEVDKGYPEMYQYIKWLWIAILLIYISGIRLSFGYLAWGILFFYFLIDDAMTIHERIGFYFADNFNFVPPMGLRLNDCGELAASAIAAIIFGSIIIGAYIRGNQVFRKISQDLILLVLMLFFFGIVIDMSIYAFHVGQKGMEIMGFIEDAGEMLVTSIILWYVFLTSVREKNSDTFICDYIRIFPK